MMKAWFISDIHLKDINERNSQRLLRFLHFLESDLASTTHLFLVGDIFDLWVGDSDVFYRQFRGIVDQLLSLKQKGVEIIYFEGNHDVHIQKFWTKRFQIPVYVEAQTFQLGRFNVRVEHGDFINPEDKAYIRYLSIIRSAPLRWIAESLSGQIFNYFGQKASKASRQRSQGYRQDSESLLRERIRRFAESQRAMVPFDFLITGHMHVRDDYSFSYQGMPTQSINLGSWFKEPMAYCLTHEGGSWFDIQE